MHQGTSTVGEINAVTITRDMLRLYGRHAFTVASVSLIIQGGALVASIAAMNVLGLFGILAWLAFAGIAYQLSMGVFTMLLLHLRHGHDVPSTGYLLKEASAHIVPLLWLGALVVAGTFIGFMLLVIPGIYLTLRWAVASPALVARRVSAVEALRISGELTQGHKGTVWGLAIIAGFFSNGVPRIIEATNPTMAMENVIVVNAIVATFATPIVALATAELFFRLMRVPDRIVPGAPLGGPAPAPAGPFVPTAAIPAQPAPGPYVPQPAPAAGFVPAHAYAAPAAHPGHHAPAGFAPQPAVAHAYAPPVQPAPPQHYAPPVQPAAPQHYAPPVQAAAAQHYAPPVQPAAAQHYAPPVQPAAAQHYAPPVQPAAPQHYAPPVQPAPPQHYAPPVQAAAAQHYLPPVQPAAAQHYAPPAQAAAPQHYAPPVQAAAPAMRQGPSIAPPGLG